jgi:tetratricopeptide (TPR) repeat protein
MKSRLISKRTTTLAILIGTCVLLAYLPALNLGFVNWDDNKYIYENPHILTLTGGFFRWAFTTFDCGNWHPLTWLSLGLDRFLWGTGPMGFHATNIVLHGLNSALVTILAAFLINAGKSAVTREEEGGVFSDRGMMVAAATGVLFGFHPIHVESVAWISERKDVLCSFFFLAGILTYLRYACGRSDSVALGPFHRGHSSRFFFLTLLLFVLSLLSKPMAVTFPVVLLILDWYPLGRFESGERRVSILWEKLPFFALSLASSVVTIAAQKSADSVTPFSELHLMDRLFVGSQSVAMYLWKLFVPLDLIPFYPYPRDFSPLSVKYFLAFLAIAGIAISCVVLLRSKKGQYWIAAWSYYLVTLLPVLGIIQVGNQSMADRYAYLPSIGPFLLVALGLVLAFERRRATAAEYSSGGYTALVALGFLALTLSCLTVRQTGVWKDGLTFWSYVIEKKPQGIDIAYNNRGNIYLKQGRLDDALRDFNTALTINPNFVRFYLNRAEVFNRLGNHEKTLADLTSAVTLKPDYELGYLYRSMFYNALGDHERALVDLTTAVTIKPDYVVGYFHRGNTYSLIGRYSEAIADFSKAIALSPDNAYLYVNRGTTYYQMKRFDQAIADFSKALSLAPNSPNAHFHRGKSYLISGNTRQAALDFETACKMGYMDGCRAIQALTQ